MCHPPHDHDGACETCQREDEVVVFHAPTPPLSRDGGEAGGGLPIKDTGHYYPLRFKTRGETQP